MPAIALAPQVENRVGVWLSPVVRMTKAVSLVWPELMIPRSSSFSRMKASASSIISAGPQASIVRYRAAGEMLLTATARVKQQGKLTGVYDIEIVNQQQKTVALFRGKSHRIGGTITGEV